MKLIIKEFFGKEGLTTTSANHIANMAKELYSKLESEINEISAFDKTAKIIGDNTEMLIHSGTTSSDFNAINNKLRKIAECKGLIAYLREAIKERDSLYKTIESYVNIDKRNELISPKREPLITVEEIMSSWSIGELIRYYRLEAKCATLGKYIHEKGKLNVLRKEYYKTIQNPIEINGNGRDTLAVTNTATLTSEEIEDKFFTIQEEYRNAQAELNGMKHSIEEAIEKDKIKKDEDFKLAYNKYNGDLQNLDNEECVEKNCALKELQELKIIIPTYFKNIYEEISNLSKNN